MGLFEHLPAQTVGDNSAPETRSSGTGYTAAIMAARAVLHQRRVRPGRADGDGAGVRVASGRARWPRQTLTEPTSSTGA